MKTKKTRFSWGGVALLVCGLVALTGFFAAQSQRASAATSAFVRIIHGSPFVGTADIFVDGSPLLTSFGFGAVTPYVALPAGPHKVQIALTGKGIGASALIQTLAVAPGGVYTVAATGTSAQTLKLVVFFDNNLAAPGTTKTRLYQLAPDGGWIDTLAGSKWVTGANYLQSSNYFTLSSGAYTFNLKSDVGSRSLSATLKANTVNSLFVVGVFNPSKFNGEPQAKVVLTSTAALPGLPSTGSDPLPGINGGQLSTPWLLIALAMVFAGGTLFTRRLFGSR